MKKNGGGGGLKQACSRRLFEKKAVYAGEAGCGGPSREIRSWVAAQRARDADETSPEEERTARVTQVQAETAQAAATKAYDRAARDEVARAKRRAPYDDATAAMAQADAEHPGWTARFGQLVWVQIGSSPHWPAMLVNPRDLVETPDGEVHTGTPDSDKQFFPKALREMRKGGDYTVFFLGEGQWAHVNGKNIDDRGGAKNIYDFEANDGRGMQFHEGVLNCKKQLSKKLKDQFKDGLTLSRQLLRVPQKLRKWFTVRTPTHWELAGGGGGGGGGASAAAAAYY